MPAVSTGGLPVSKEAAKFENLSRGEFVAFLEGIGKTTLDGRPAEASRTAFITAFIRAFHSVNENPKVFDDWMAAQLLTAEEYSFFEEMYYRRTLKDLTEVPAFHAPRRSVITTAMRAGAAAGILSRARFAEESLEKAVAAGVRQYVLLGAGLDTFALRRADLISKIRVIEVDHPATQAIKRQRLAAMGFSLPPSLHFVAVDFSAEDLPCALSRSCYDFEIPAFFSWLGVTYYLEREHLFHVLRRLGETAAPQSLIAFDYMSAEAFDPGKATAQVQKLKDKVRGLGEPMKTGLDPKVLGRDLMAVGWELRQNLSAEDIEEIYFQRCTKGFRAGKHLHLALAALPSRPGIRGG
jgi:methyltransferase (TIGR00027 family)